YSDYLDEQGQTLEYDSYMVPETELQAGDLRLLEVDNRVLLPLDSHVRFIVTARDVIHSFAVPSLGIKLDCVPGRLNQFSVLINREGAICWDALEAVLLYSWSGPCQGCQARTRAKKYSNGQLAGNSRSGPQVSAKNRGNIKVSPEQHEVIVGSLLGDMSATRPPGPKRNTRLSIGQANLPYLLSLADLLASLIRQQNLTPDNKLDRTTGIQYYGYKLCTMSLPCLNIYREWFYPEGVKIVPNDIPDHLTPLGLAHWFMQDGSKTTDNG
ncbi:2260_t:CDS:2, partial [Acaulospora colombiana]